MTYFAGSTNANLTNRGNGRPRGSLNKTHAVARWGLTEAYRQLGGVDGLVEWGKNNRGEFYKLFVKLIPAEIADQHGLADTKIQVMIVPASTPVLDAKDKALQQDAEVLTLDPPKVETESSGPQ